MTPVDRGTHADAPLGNKAQRTRANILQATQDELVEKDGHLEITAIAQRCGISAGLIYRYFPSRTELVAAAVDAFYDRYDSWVMDTNPLPGGSWIERERERVSRCLHFLRRDPLSRIVLLNQQKEPEVAAVENRRLAAHLDLAVNNVKHAQAAGEIPDDIDATIACAMTMGGIRQVMVSIMSGQCRLSHRKTLEQVTLQIAGAMKIKV